MQALRSTLTLLAVAAALGGCASSVPLEDTKAPVETRSTTGSGAGAAAGGQSGGTSQSQVATVDLGAQADAEAARFGRTVYFDFDSFTVRDDARPLIEAQAKRLTTDRKKGLRIEGHTDERGGREYNLALGQKRAEAVVKSLELLGVNTAQLEATSFGKERPAAEGNDEAAWAKNRRAELKDR